MAKFNNPLRLMQAGNAQEFMSGPFASHFLENGIQQRWSLPHQQWQNGVADSHVKLVKFCGPPLMAPAHMQGVQPMRGALLQMPCVVFPVVFPGTPQQV